MNYLAFDQSENAKIEQKTYILPENDMHKSILVHPWVYPRGMGEGVHAWVYRRGTYSL